MDPVAQARAWLEFGEELTEPVPGAIVVVQPASSAATSGHVGFYVGEEEDKIVLIAGNVQNSVRIHRIGRSRVLGYRGYGG